MAQVIDWVHAENKVTNPNAKTKTEKPAAKPKPTAAPAAAGAAPSAVPAAAPAGDGADLDGNTVESGVGGKSSNPDRGIVGKVWIIPSVTGFPSG